jgi:ABC-type antimicrobial peptide transport system permease subunit
MLANLRFYLRHSLNDLRVNGRRTLFALLCIAAGVAAIVSLQTLGVMIDNTLSDNLRETNRGDIAISPFGGGFDDDESEALGNQDEDSSELVDDSEGQPRFTAQGIQTIEEWFAENYDGEVRLTTLQPFSDPLSGLAISLPAKDTDKGPVLVYTVDPQAYPLFGEIITLDERPLSEALSAPTDIVLSENLATDLEARVGDTVRLNRASEEFTVRGIVSTDTEGGLRNPFAGLLGYYYISQAAIPLFEPNPEPSASGIFIGLDNGDLEVVDELSRRFEEDFPDFTTTSTADIEEQNSVLSTVVNQLVTVMGLISLLIGGIGIVNTMLVIVSRRTTEVAVLKTLGMNAENVTLLFLVEAIIMGILGSLLGIVLGWLMAWVLRFSPEQLVAQPLEFQFALTPAINGFLVGIAVTAIFGFIPILAAGQVRPANVLRPSETIIPRNGLLRSFAALMFLVFAISLMSQGFINALTDFGSTGRIITGINGVIIGLLMALPIIIGGYIELRKVPKSDEWTTKIVLWIILFFGLPALGFVFGYLVPATIVVTVSFIIIASLYLLLVLMIWAVSGAPLREFPIIGVLPFWLVGLILAASVLWTAFIAFVILIVKLGGTGLALFLGLLLPIHIITVIFTLVLPWWVVGQLFQRFGFLDLKVALRAMAATKTRGASALLALVIGIFTLSTITMLVDRLQYQVDKLLEDLTGGNVIIFPGVEESSIQAVDQVLASSQGVETYALLRSYETTLISVTDVSQEETLPPLQLTQRVSDYVAELPTFGGEAGREELESDYQDDLGEAFGSVDARDLSANLPDVNFRDGRQLDARLDNQADADGYFPIVMTATQGIIAADIGIGDLVTFAIGENQQEITFRVVGLVDASQGSAQTVVAPTYAPMTAFGDLAPDTVLFLADIAEEDIPTVRRELNDIPNVFIFETRLLNELFRSLIEQFTSFPILVTALSLFTGGIVIANSVALSTMERRREIGIMKAVGLQRERVLGMLLLENGLMGLAGGLIGVGMGVIALFFLLVVLLSSSIGEAIPITRAFLLMGLCILIALVASILSVWGASGEKPLNVLRYE